MQPSEKLHFGLEMEKKAAQLIVDAGAHILMANFRYQGGEIDLIVEERDVGTDAVTLVFVEVRVRRKGAWFRGIESVDGLKLLRLKRGVDRFLARYRGHATGTRLDLMVWDGDAWTRYRDVTFS